MHAGCYVDAAEILCKASGHDRIALRLRAVGTAAGAGEAIRRRDPTSKAWESEAATAMAGPGSSGSFSRRRLPIYIVMDHSAAVSGTAIVSLNGGLQNFRQTLGTSAVASLTFLSLIAFADAVEQIPLGLVQYFMPPRLDAQGACHLGEALDALQRRLDFDLIPDRPGQPGDLRPLVFVLLAGQPTDAWTTQADWLLQQARAHILNVVGIALSDGACQPLKRCAPTVLKIEAGRAVAITGFFHWMNAVAEAALLRAASQPGGSGINVAPPPGVTPC